MNKTIILIIYSLIFFSCNSEDKRNDNGGNQDTRVSFEAQVDTTSKTGRFIHLIPCHGILSKVEKISGVAHEKVSIHDWTHGGVFLSPKRGSDGEWYKKSFSVKTLSYKYKDSVVVYLHLYKYIQRKDNLDAEKIVKDLNNKSLSVVRNTMLAERIFMYFIEETNDYDIVVIDVPPNWESSFELREEFKQKLFETFSCTYLLCDRGKPCYFKNPGNASN